MARKKLKRELIEWAILLSIIGTIYLNGWHLNIATKLQQLVLATGLITPNIEEIYDKEMSDFSYNLQIHDTRGYQADMQKIRGKSLFINFWAVWCVPCRAELLNIQKLYDKMGDQVVFLMISIKSDPQKVKDFIKENDYTFPVYFLSSELPPELNAEVLPTTYVISPKGKIRLYETGLANYHNKTFIEFLKNL